LQIWNHANKPDKLPKGFNKWRELLSQGRKIYIEGGSDAHGDFNAGFGKVRTCCKSSLSETEILDALKNGKCYMTSGPAIKISIQEKEIGDTIKLHPGFVNLTITAKSSSEFGELKWIETYVDDRPPVRYDASGYGFVENKLKYLLPSDRYIFAVAETDKGYRAYTNPIWLELENGTCNDSVRNQDESAVDCGGVCPKCSDNKSCVRDSDCLSGYCNPNHICSIPTCFDGWRNGNESGVDCGGNCSECTASGILNATVWNIGRANASDIVVCCVRPIKIILIKEEKGG
jgi:hypothetical protein